MKRFISVFLIIAIMISCWSFALASGNLPGAVHAEAPEGSDRTVKITETDIKIVAGGKKVKLTEEITTLREDAPEKSTLVWSSSDTSIARVDAGGNVSGVKPGSVIITSCLKDNPEVKAWTEVTVVRPVKGIKLSEKALTLTPPSSRTVTVTIMPKDATNQEVKWSPSNPEVASVSETGEIKALYGDECEITCTTEDGAYSAAVKVHVPSFSIERSAYTVISTSGLTIDVNRYSGDALSLKNNGRSNFDVIWDSDEGKITIVPKKAGTGSIVVYNENVPKDKVTVSIKIGHSAIYERRSYPKIDYISAARYPSTWKGSKVWFSGKEQFVRQNEDTTVCRISSKGQKDNIVYVTIDNSNILTSVTEGKMVTVYGTYDGIETYTPEGGQSVTVPHVKAERIESK